MRFVLCLVIWFLFVGGLYLYTSGRDSSFARSNVAPTIIEKKASSVMLELTPTFSVEEDPFALKTDTAAGPFEIRINGIVVPSEDLQISRGKTLVIDDVSAVIGDLNEVFIKASPPVSENSLDHGIRVRLLSDGSVLADETIWNSGGGLVSGTLSFSTEEQGEADHGN